MLRQHSNRILLFCICSLCFLETKLAARCENILEIDADKSFCRTTIQDRRLPLLRRDLEEGEGQLLRHRASAVLRLQEEAGAEDGLVVLLLRVGVMAHIE